MNSSEDPKKTPSDKEAIEVLRFYRASADRIADPIARAEFLKDIEYLENNTPPRQVALIAQPRTDITSWKNSPWIVAIGLTLSGFLGWFALQQGVDILLAETLTYTKTGGPPKTVSPSNGAFEFYYQVAFFLVLGVFGAAMAISALLVLCARTSSNSNRLHSFGKITRYFAGCSGMVWIALHLARYWLI